MTKLIKFLKPFSLAILVAIGLLYVQAMTDLALPDYMSNIVNNGIQNNGIDRAVPEVMVVDNIISGIIRKEKLSVSEIEDAIQSNSANGSIGLINSIAELFVDDRITLDQAKAQIEEKNIEILNRTIMQLKIKRGNNGNHIGY